MEFNPYIQEVYKEKKCTRTNNKLENGLVYLSEDSQFNVMNASTICTKKKS
jgi:hypothetical protein